MTTGGETLGDLSTAIYTVREEWTANFFRIMTKNCRVWRFVSRYYIVKNRLSPSTASYPASLFDEFIRPNSRAGSSFELDLARCRARTTSFRAALACLVRELRHGR